MDGGRKTLILLTLCALVGAGTVQRRAKVEFLVAVPGTHLGETEITSAVFTAGLGHQFTYTIVAQKNQTRCANDSRPSCLSQISRPEVGVFMTATTENERPLRYSDSVRGELELDLHIGPKPSVSARTVNGLSDKITIVLDIMYDTSNTTRDSFSSQRRPERFTLTAEFVTTTMEKESDNTDGNGQAALRSAPLCALLLPALLPVFLLK